MLDLAQKLSRVLSDLATQPDTASVCSLKVANIFKTKMNSSDEDKTGLFENEKLVDNKDADTSDEVEIFVNDDRYRKKIEVSGEGSNNSRVTNPPSTGAEDDSLSAATDGGTASADSIDTTARRSSGWTCQGSGYGKILMEEDEVLDDQEFKLVVENYVGLVSLLHNATHLGYFKMRGKISF